MIFTAFRFFALLSLGTMISCATFKGDVHTIEVDAKLVLRAFGDCAQTQAQVLPAQLFPVAAEVLTAVSTGNWDPVLGALELAGIHDGAAIVACVRPKIDALIANPGPPLPGSAHIVIRRK